MLQVRGGLDLLEEPLVAEHRGELGAKHLQGDPSVVTEVVREVDRGHAAVAQFEANAVTVLQRSGQASRHGGHGGFAGWGSFAPMWRSLEGHASSHLKADGEQGEGGLGQVASDK